jgi:exopolysaccharide biosynthesis polyprenyl glycosylphosphotransferase
VRNERASFILLLYVLCLPLADAAMIYAAFRVARTIWRLRLIPTRPTLTEVPPASDFNPLVLLVAAMMIGTFLFYNLYIPRRGISRIDLLFAITPAVVLAFGLALAVSTFFNLSLDLPRSTLIIWAVLSAVFVWFGRLVLDTILRALRKRGFDETRVLIVGTGQTGEIVLEKIRHAPELGYRVIGFVDNTSGLQTVDDVPVLGVVSELPSLIETHRIREVIVATSEISHQELLALASIAARLHFNLKSVPDIFQIMSSEVTTSELSGLPMTRVRDVALRGWNLTLKRGMDILISAAALVILAPLYLALALAIKVTSRREPVFYVQERVGLDGRPFHLVKFRSMRDNAESHTGPVWATPNDPRRTRLGTLLRRWSLDELPQMINVLAGEMSLVGPRPERPHFVEQFSRYIPRYSERHNEKAGVTGWAQVNGLRGQTSIEERTRYDLFYVEHWSLAFDVKILLKTIGAVFRDKNAY